MCGIAGVLGTADKRLVESMTQALYHRGPDGVGYHSDRELHIGMQRLSIIDVNSGWQPIYNETRDKCVVFNGEIYNYRELRKSLREKGHVFETQTDTEVIVHLYEEYGARCVEHLQGMFAFAIADGQKLFLARDRLGIKPLYYACLRDQFLFVFASEIKALLRCKEVSTTLNMQAFADSIVVNYPVGTHTFFEDIRSFPPGHTMVVTKNQGGVLVIDEKEYYNLSLIPNESITLDEAKEKLTSLLHSTVESHLIADVAVGLNLSGGLDSSQLAMIMNECYGQKILAFTIADDEEHPDIVQSKLVAGCINSMHDITMMSFNDYLQAIPGCIIAEEQPSSLFGLPFYFLCNQIGQKVKVCLNGEGADELFGGYPEYTDRSYQTSYLRKNLAISSKLGVLPSPGVLDIIDKLSSASSFDEYLKQMFAIYLKDQLIRQHLELVDKYSMAASLESRVPYMDHQLVEFVNTLPIHFKVNWRLGITKYILKKVALDAYGGRLMDIVLRKKLGLPSAGVNFLSKFDKLCNDLLPDDYLNRHEMGFCFSSKRQLLLFELFSEIFMNQRGLVSDKFDVIEFIKDRCSSGAVYLIS